MKNFILITFIIAFVFPQSVFAENDISVFAENDIYLKGSAGMFSVPSSNVEFLHEARNLRTKIGRFDYKRGFGLSVAIGKSFNNGLDFELEYAHKQAKLKRFSGDLYLGPNKSGALKAYPINDKDHNSSITIKTLMTNAIYNLRRKDSIITPYVGVGVGVAWIDLDEFVKGEFFGTKFAYQLLGGVALSVSKNTSITAGYRYLGLSDASSDTDLIGGDVAAYGEGFSPIDSHNFEMGLKYSF
jgi:opacity protein-like surface antigen